MDEHQCTWAYDESDINRTITCMGGCGRAVRIRLDADGQMEMQLLG